MPAETPIGRDDDIAAVIDHLANARTVTVLGTGGLGKTTVARAVVDQLPDGGQWIDLASLVEEDDIISAAVRTLGASSIEGWAVSRSEDTPLVVLDNCEHVLAPAAALAERLLAEHPEVRLLATSRVELGVADEIRYRLAPLSTTVGSTGTSPAAELFLARCRSAGATWPTSATNLTAVESVVSRVAGIPLAIELAAAQALAISPAQLASLMTDSLTALSDPDEASGLRAVIASSHRRLQPATQRFFRAVSLLSGTFELDIAAAISTDEPLTALDHLGELLRESLITVEHTDDGGSDFRLLEPVREFAQEELRLAGEVGMVEDRFVDAMVAFAVEVIASAIGSFDPMVLSRAAGRFGHLFRAIEIALREDESPNRAYRLFLPLFVPSSGARHDVAALGRRIRHRWPDDPDPLRAEALAVIAHTAMNVGADDEAIATAHAALEVPEASALARLLAHRTLGSVAAFADDYATAERHFLSALDEAEQFGGVFGREMRATLLGFQVDDTSALEGLAVLCDQAAALEDDVSLGWTLVAMINIQLQNDLRTEALRHLDRAEIAAANSPLIWSVSSVARSRAILESAEGNWVEAAQAWERCLSLMASWGDAEGIGVCLRTAAAAAELCGERTVAEALWACRPPGRANTILPRPFTEQEAALLERLGPPLPVALPVAVAQARAAMRPAVEADRPPARAPMMDRSVVRFEPGYELDLSRYELRQDGVPIHVEPQVFDVLAHLATNAGQLITKEQLMDEVWGTRFVTAAAVSSRIRSARVAVGDDGRTQKVIRTVHGRGFEFVAPVVGCESG